MKRNGIILIATMAAFLFAGQAFSAGIPMTAASPQASGGEIDGSSPFTIDIYMANESAVELGGCGMSFGFSSPDGSIANIAHVDVGGNLDIPSIEYINGFLTYFDLMIIYMDDDTYLDGTLPDYINIAPVGIAGMPNTVTSTAFIRFNIQVDYSTTGTTGQLCVDSIGAAQMSGNVDWDWLFPNEDATFNGTSFDPYCWTITNLTSLDVNQISTATDNLPTDFSLEQNYPNPFNPSTTFDFSLPKQSLVKIDIFNVLGQKIKTLADGEYEAGKYSVNWDGTDNNGSSAATGIYFYKMNADDFQDTKKLMLLK